MIEHCKADHDLAVHGRISASGRVQCRLCQRAYDAQRRQDLRALPLPPRPPRAEWLAWCAGITQRIAEIRASDEAFDSRLDDAVAWRQAS